MPLEVIKHNIAEDCRTWWQRVVVGAPQDTKYVGPDPFDVLQVAKEQNRQHSAKWHGCIGAIHFPRKQGSDKERG